MSLPNHRSNGSQQLGEAVPVGDGSFPAAVIPAFIFHARDIAATNIYSVSSARKTGE